MSATRTHLRAVQWAVVVTDKDTKEETVRGYVWRDTDGGWVAMGLNGRLIDWADTQFRATLAVLGKGDKPKYREPRVAK